MYTLAPDVSVSNAAYCGTLLVAPHDLVKRFGPLRPPSGDGKISGSYAFSDGHGNVAVLYDWIIAVLRESEAGDVPIKVLCKRHNISEQTFFRWRNKYGGMDVPDARRLKDLEAENARLKRLLAEQVLVIDGLKEFSRKK